MKKPTLKVAAGVGALVILLAGTAIAAQHGGKHRMFMAVDANDDAKISKQEANDFIAKRFDRYDTNKDGKASAEEIDAALNKRIERMRKRILARFDDNEDGVIAKTELQAKMGKLFAVIDVNDDGQVTPRELRKTRKMWRGHRHGHRFWRSEMAE